MGITYLAAPGMCMVSKVDTLGATVGAPLAVVKTSGKNES